MNETADASRVMFWRRRCTTWFCSVIDEIRDLSFFGMELPESAQNWSFWSMLAKHSGTRSLIVVHADYGLLEVLMNL